MKKIIFDIEANGLLRTITKIHCLSYTVVGEWEVKTIFDYDEMREFFKQDAIFIGHFIANYDLPSLVKVLGITVDFTFYDTIFLSNYLFPGRLLYKLESFGEDYGIPKIKVGKDEWDGEGEEFQALMKKRCEQDVRINSNLWVNIELRLLKLYKKDDEIIQKLLNYFAFKASCAFKQMLNPCKLDIDAAGDALAELYLLKAEKEDVLVGIMPKVPVTKIKTLPPKLVKKNGELSEAGKSWYSFLKEYDLPEDNIRPIEYVVGYDEPNPRSHVQIKDWLFGLGWVPDVYRFERNKETGEVKQIPQVLNDKKELSDSVMLLVEDEPGIEVLAGLGRINHRISLIEGLVNSSEDGWIAQEIVGVTSTHRARHSAIVNLPGSDKFFGDRVRSLFIAPEGYTLFGVDVVSSEARCRDHYIMPYDPEYVAEMSVPDFDAHLDIAVRAGLLTQEQSLEHKNGTVDHGKVRKVAKVINFSVLYKVGPASLSRSTGFPDYKCKGFIEAYWDRNWAVLEVEKNAEIKSEFGFKWIRNPVSGFWLELRNDKDRFSALNQNLSTYFMDTFIMYCQIYGIEVRLQMHDELMNFVPNDKVEETMKIFKKAERLTNERLKLNVYISVDPKHGINYSETH